MRPNFLPLRGLVVFLFLILLTSFAPAADKKRKSAEPEAASKAKAKPTQKADPKQQAKASRESGKKDEQNKQQLARQKKKDEDSDKKRGQDVSKLAAKSREEKADSRKKAKLEADQKNEKTKDKSARREQDKKAEKTEKAVAKKQQPEKAAKSSTKPDAKSELAAAKTKSGSKPNKQETPREATARVEESKKSKRDSSADSSKSLAKLETRAKPDFKPESRFQAEKAKELPAVKFTLRPIAKVAPRVELKFSVARAVAGNSFDAPPPQDNGPDVIDVIEHDSPEAGRLDDVLRSEMKTLQFSGVPSNSRRKMDVGKMDAERIKQIQEVLAKKGYYSGEITGQYDDVTIEAMRKFQETHKVDVTGYATAQSLRLLGLTDW